MFLIQNGIIWREWMPIIRTGRMKLLPLAIEHLQMCLGNSPDLERALGCTLAPDSMSDHSRRAMAVKIQKMKDAPKVSHAWYTYWLMVLEEGNTGVGLVGFKGTPDINGEVEIGYGISPSYQNHGYMTEAVEGLVGWAFHQPACLAVVAETLRANYASQRVLEKSGFIVTRASQTGFYWRLEKNDDNK